MVTKYLTPRTNQALW